MVNSLTFIDYAKNVMIINEIKKFDLGLVLGGVGASWCHAQGDLPWSRARGRISWEWSQGEWFTEQFLYQILRIKGEDWSCIPSSTYPSPCVCDVCSHICIDYMRVCLNTCPRTHSCI